MAYQLSAARGSLWALALILAASVASVQAQDGPSARDRQAAARAYDRGTAAYLAEDFVAAARWFETAHRLAPASVALVQATRAHTRAGNPIRAATLGLQLQELYSDDETASGTATRALANASDYFRLDAECEGCTLEVDGVIHSHGSFFVSPNEEHRVVASFDTGNREQTVRGGPGERETIRFEAPEPSATDSETDDAVGPTGPEAPGETTPAASGGGGVPLGVTVTALILTAGLGGVLIWSGVDTLDGVPAYEANPTPEGLADGRMREERTNWLIASTAVAGAATVVLMIFTDWEDGGGQPSGDPDVSFDIRPDGVTFGLSGTF